MRPGLRALLATLAAGIVMLTGAAFWRVARVDRAAAAIPLYPGLREGGGGTRYFPLLMSWDDRSSARLRRVFALSHPLPLSDIGRHAHAALGRNGWYLVSPEDLDRIQNPQVIVWQREPDERLDLTVLWPLPGMTREQRLYGGIFPAEFLDAPLVIEWSWALGGPRSPLIDQPELEVRIPPPPRP